MKQTMVFLLLLFTAGLGCRREFSTSPVRAPVRPLTEEEKVVVATSNDFGLRLFSEVAAAKPNENVFLSPYSVAVALAMTANGAAGETKQAMLETLGFSDSSVEEMDQAFRSLTLLILGLDPKVELEIANAIWYRQGLHVRRELVDLVQKYFGAPVRALDFGDAGSSDVVNEWVKEQTHDKIRKILDRIDPQDVMFLANAIYFKALWTYQFEKEKTQDDTFYGPDGQEIPCRMMVQTVDELPYFRGDGFAAVDLPYGDGLFAMTILLPDEGSSVDSLVNELSPSFLADLERRFQSRKVTVFLPRFKIRFGAKLNDVLKKMGMAVAFTPGAADFSRLFDEDLPLYIGFVKHKAFVQVDEEGTEAAAVTVVGIRLTAVGGGENVVFFRVNRPFVFVIRDRHSNTVLFAGRIVEPKWEE